MAITHLVPIDPALDALDSIAAALADSAAQVEVECRGAGRDRALEIAEAVEVLARRVGHLQLVAARAVDVGSPAPSGAGALGVERVAAGEPAEDGEGAEFAGAGAGAGAGAAGVGEPGSPYRRTRDLLRDHLRISGSEASRRLKLAAEVVSRVSLLGEVLPPSREGLADAVPEISLDAARVVVRAVERVEAVLGTDQSEVLERLLVGYAATFDPDQLARIADRAVALADPDGAEPHVSVAAARQGVHIGPTRQGLTTVRLVVDTLQLEVLRTVFDAGTNPRVRQEWSVPRADDAPAGAGASEGPSETSPEAVVGESGAGRAEVPFDPRTRPQLMLDALIAAAGCALRSQDLPVTGGTPTQVAVTIDAALLCDALADRAGLTADRDSGRDGDCDFSTDRDCDFGTDRDGVFGTDRGFGSGTDHDRGSGTDHDRGFGADRDRGFGADRDSGSARRRTSDPPDWERRWREDLDSGARLTHGGPVPFRLVRRLACDADIIPVVLGTDGRILDLGTSHRLFPAWMRRALAARDGGCAFPGCCVPAPWTEAHHIVPWYLKGPTSVANGVLLCSYHHHLVHEGHWVVVAPHHGGRVRFEPATRISSVERRSGVRRAGAPRSSRRRSLTNRFHTG